MLQIPQAPAEAEEAAKAGRSIAAYVGRSSHFFALCPTVPHKDLDGVICDYGSWLQSSGCRFELFCLLLSQREQNPPIVSVTITTNSKFRVKPNHLQIHPTGGERWGCNPIYDLAHCSTPAFSWNWQHEVLCVQACGDWRRRPGAVDIMPKREHGSRIAQIVGFAQKVPPGKK